MSEIILHKTTITSNFSIVPNDITFSTQMTLNEIGALIWLLAKPERYGLNIKSLATQWSVGLHTVKKISKKFQLLGYLHIERFGDGRTQWHISDHPIIRDDKQVEKPHVENRLVEKEPHVENPHVENPHVDNRPVLERTDLLIRTDHIKNIYIDNFEFLNNKETKAFNGDIKTALQEFKNYENYSGKSKTATYWVKHWLSWLQKNKRVMLKPPGPKFTHNSCFSLPDKPFEKYLTC